MLVKRGASSQQPNKPVTYTTAKQIITQKNRVKIRWAAAKNWKSCLQLYEQTQQKS
jgi:hypothetical protein